MAGCKAGRTTRWGALLGCAWLLGWGTALKAWAHDPGFSSVRLEWTGDEVRGVVLFNNVDIAAINADHILNESVVVWVDGRRIAPTHQEIVPAPRGHREVRVRFALAPVREARFESALLERLDPGHRQLAILTTEEGFLIAERLLRAGDASLVAPFGQDGSEVGTPSGWHRMTAFFVYGVEHIVTGFDHLLFLFAVLLGCRTVSELVGVITVFTVAHSITLAAAALNWVPAPGWLVEPVIAASIVWAALMNLARRDEQRRPHLALTFAFGLVHGLGFAGLLAEAPDMGTGWTLVSALFAFNLGIEFGQLAVATIALGLLWPVRNQPLFARWVAPACSILIGIIGLVWLVERTWFA